MPRLYINLRLLEKNAKEVLSLCSKHNVELIGVTKVSLGDPQVAQCIRNAGVNIIGESRVENIKRMVKSGINRPFMMLRIPAISQLEEIVDLCDYILVSELKTVEAIEEICKNAGKSVDLIYMVDVGDLREGVWYKQAEEEICKAVKICKTSRIIGVGTNLGCYGGILPTNENMAKLVYIRDKIEQRTNTHLPIVSGGNTAALKLLEHSDLPEGVNQYRVGEAIMLGTDVTNNRKIDWLEQKTVVLEAEVIEMKTKPSVPEGQSGLDAFGRQPVFVDKGLRKRAILALGEQDTVPKHLKPLDKNAEVIHASSDHTIVDITEVQRQINVGDTMKFTLSYAALLRAMTCPHVEKIYRGE